MCRCHVNDSGKQAQKKQKQTQTQTQIIHLLGGDGRIDNMQALHELLLVHCLAHRLLVSVRIRIGIIPTSPSFFLILVPLFLGALKQPQRAAQAVHRHCALDLHEHRVRALHALVVGERGLLQHAVHPAVLAVEEARVVLEVVAHGVPGIDQQVDEVVHVLWRKGLEELNGQ